jgi:hypothetical protein
MLKVILRVSNDGCSLGVGQSSLDVLPQVMEVHDLVVVKLFFIQSHLLLVELLLLDCPVLRIGHELETVEIFRYSSLC